MKKMMFLKKRKKKNNTNLFIPFNPEQLWINLNWNKRQMHQPK